MTGSPEEEKERAWRVAGVLAEMVQSRDRRIRHMHKVLHMCGDLLLGTWDDDNEKEIAMRSCERELRRIDTILKEET